MRNTIPLASEWMPDQIFDKMMSVLVEVGAERKRQFSKRGVQNREQKEWVCIAAEEMGEVSKEVVDHFLRGDTPKQADALRLRAEWLQLAAVCVQSIEELDRQINELEK